MLAPSNSLDPLPDVIYSLSPLPAPGPHINTVCCRETQLKKARVGRRGPQERVWGQSTWLLPRAARLSGGRWPFKS